MPWESRKSEVQLYRWARESRKAMVCLLRCALGSRNTSFVKGITRGSWERVRSSCAGRDGSREMQWYVCCVAHWGREIHRLSKALRVRVKKEWGPVEPVRTGVEKCNGMFVAFRTGIEKYIICQKHYAWESRKSEVQSCRWGRGSRKAMVCVLRCALGSSNMLSVNGIACRSQERGRSKWVFNSKTPGARSQEPEPEPDPELVRLIYRNIKLGPEQELEPEPVRLIYRKCFCTNCSDLANILIAKCIQFQKKQN